MGQYEDQVEVVEAEVISDGSESSQKDYWRETDKRRTTRRIKRRLSSSTS